MKVGHKKRRGRKKTTKPVPHGSHRSKRAVGKTRRGEMNGNRRRRKELIELSAPTLDDFEGEW